MTMTIEMPDTLAERVRARCEREGRSVGEVALAFFAEWVAEREPRNSVRNLKGLLRWTGPAVSLDDMDRAIASGSAQ